MDKLRDKASKPIEQEVNINKPGDPINSKDIVDGKDIKESLKTASKDI